MTVHPSNPSEAKPFGQPAYGITRRLGRVDFERAREATIQALAAEGFGVLTEIDVKATLKKKLDVDVAPYRILGACNPPLAHRAMSEEPAIGLLLPCNVVVAEDADGQVVVSAIDPPHMLSVVERPDLDPLADEVKQKLARAVERIVV